MASKRIPFHKLLHFTKEEIKKRKTLMQSHFDNLKYEDKYSGIRVWLSRLTVADGEPFNNKVTVELYNPNNGMWYEYVVYEAK